MECLEKLQEVFKEMDIPLAHMLYQGTKTPFAVYTFIQNGLYSDNLASVEATNFQIRVNTDRNFIKLMECIKCTLRDNGFLVELGSYTGKDPNVDLYYFTLNCQYKIKY